MDYKYLSEIKSPKDIKKLNIEELTILCDEIRDCIITTVSQNGGHLASNLGAVELTVALHYVFDSPFDAIIFDVGHQSYTHKLLTGRYEQFSGLRSENGISGFTRPNESEHDIFVSGHSSTAISSAYGLLKGKRLSGKDGKAIAVVGDGAMTGGMVYEALNNCGRDQNDAGLIIILNDNEMSISENVGALAKYFAAIREKKSYFNFKRNLKKILAHIPLIGSSIDKFLSNAKDFIKLKIYRNGNIFEDFGFEYFGPTDGHNLKKLIKILGLVKREKRPVVLHSITVKGKGYKPAEENPGLYHGVGKFDINTGVLAGTTTDFSSVFGKKLCELAKDNKKICAITAAMPDGTGLNEFSGRFPDRFFDVGIAEQHAVTFSAGLAKSGMKPYFAVYSSFLQRSIDQIIHDVAIDNLGVVFCIDRAGFVGADGETHQGLFDISLLTAIPNMSIYSPSNYDELQKVLDMSVDHQNMLAIRYPRGNEPKALKNYKASGFDFDVIGEGSTIVISYGSEFANVYDALRGIEDIKIIKLNKIFPLGCEFFYSLKNAKKIFVFEETLSKGGIGEKIGAVLSRIGYGGEFSTVSVKGFVPSASVDSDYKKFGLDRDSIIKKVLEQ